jgi:hypothetical protein
MVTIRDMTGQVRVGGGVVLAWAGAVLWAYGMTVLQPLTEDGENGNNMYWPRDIRWAAMLAGIAGLLVVAAGARRRTLAIGAGAAVWLTADILGDRAELSAGALLPTSLIAVIAVTLAAAALLWSPGDQPSRRPLTTVMVMCAGAVPAAAVISSPTDSEPQLGPARWAAIAVLTVATVVTALTAWGQQREGWGQPPENVVPGWHSGPTQQGWGAAWAARPPISGRSGAATLLAATTIAGFGTHPGFGLRTWLLGSTLIAGAWLLSRRWVSWTTTLTGFAGTLVALPILMVLVFFLSWQAGAPLTALAGNPAVNPADEDTLLVLVGMLTGLTFAAFPPMFRHVPGYRPQPAAV